MASKHNRHHRGSTSNVHAYDQYGRDDEYPANGSHYGDFGTQDYDAHMGAGGVPPSQPGTNAQQRQGGQGGQGVPGGHQGMGAAPAPNSRGRTATVTGGGARSGSRHRSHSRGTAYSSGGGGGGSGGGGGGAAGMGNAGARASQSYQANLASLKYQTQNTRCSDTSCGKPIAWRNVEDVSVSGHMHSGFNQGVNHFNNVNQNVNTGLNSSGSLGPMHANQDERDYQMMLMDILNMSKLPLADLAAATKLGDGTVPAFDELPVVSTGPAGHHGTTLGGMGGMGGGLPRQNTRAWECARLATENARRDFYYYNRALTPNVILSPHCEIHTCRYFFSRERCTFKKVQFGTVCNKHSVCPVPGCQKAKTQYVDQALSDGRKLHLISDEFCPTHRCAIEGCELRCDQAGNGDDLQHCPGHRCYYRGCDKKGDIGRGYCTKHKCQSHACLKISVSGFELCKKHIECTQHNCPLAREVLNAARVPVQKDLDDCGIDYYDRKPYLLYCNSHAYCGDSSCQLLRKKPAIYCYKHVCNETGCGLSTTEARKFCDKHRCTHDGCIQPKAWQSDLKQREDYCLGHLCRVSDCGQGAGDDRLYCDIHKCGTDGCMSRETNGLYCANHAHFHAQRVGESEAHARTERLARVLQPSHSRPDFQYYPPHPLSHIRSVYAEGPTTSRSSHSIRDSRGSRHRSGDGSSDEDGGYPRDHRDRGRDRQYRGGDSSDLPTRAGPPTRPGLHPQAGQQRPPAGPMNGNGPAPGGPGNGPARPPSGSGGRPTGSGGAGGSGGPGPGPGPGGARGGPAYVGE